MSNSEEPSAAYIGRLNAEIAVFSDQDRLHQHADMFGWRNETFLAPEFRTTFGEKSVSAVYALTISAAIERTGSHNVLSLGCGNAEEEIKVLRAADALALNKFRIRAIELSPISAARARTAAAEAGFSDRLSIIDADLNNGLPDEGPLTAIMAHHSLHHIVALERIFDDIASQLLPEGVFVTFDMIGRNGHMLWPEVRPLVRSLWTMLPNSKKFDHVFRRSMQHYQDWDCSIASFEGVRAQDILGLIASRFEPEALIAWGGISQAFLAPRTCANFSVNNAADRAYIEAIHHLEARLLEQRRTTPVEMCGVFRSRQSNFGRRTETIKRLARSIRFPNEYFTPIESDDFPNPYPQNPTSALPLLKVGIENLISPDTPAALALCDGWEPPERDGVYAMLDEQALAFEVDRAASHVNLHIWSFLPIAYELRLRVVLQSTKFIEIGPLAEGQSAVMRISSPDGLPRRYWTIRIYCSNYRRQHLAGGIDRRPLAYRLTKIEPIP